MKLSGNLGELTYCLNVHPAETWSATRAALCGPVRAVKAAVSREAPFAVGLRFSARTLDDLSDCAARDDLKRVIAEEDYRAITVNGFPYGRFHGTPVKEAVYLPDWREQARLEYTVGLADLMAEIAPSGETVSLSTVPGAFKPGAAAAAPQMADNMLRVVAHCMGLHARTGVTVALAIEPEPCCFLETVAETVAFFEDHLFSAKAMARLADLSGSTRAEAAEAAPRHLGLCYDVCHAAVEFEDAAQSLAVLGAAGVPVHKLQLSAALRVPKMTPDTRAALGAFDEPTYLHQVVSRRDGVLTRYPDLGPALGLAEAEDGAEWRVHFHVPVFVEDLGTLGTTQAFLRDILASHAVRPISPHLEVETYTFGVLPPGLAAGTVEEAVTRELRWVLGVLSR